MCVNHIDIEHERERRQCINFIFHTTVPAFDAIRGHRSACSLKKRKIGQEYDKSSEEIGRTHSFATGPVIAEPFISPLGLTITPALSF